VRAEACEPSGRLPVTVRETDDSWPDGQGAPPFDQRIEATLNADGDQTVLVVDVRGMPVELLSRTGRVAAKSVIPRGSAPIAHYCL
jgi:1,6-anhydro-N-acetylmuramate kinase